MMLRKDAWLACLLAIALGSRCNASREPPSSALAGIAVADAAGEHPRRGHHHHSQPPGGSHHHASKSHPGSGGDHSSHKHNGEHHGEHHGVHALLDFVQTALAPGSQVLLASIMHTYPHNFLWDWGFDRLYSSVMAKSHIISALGFGH